MILKRGKESIELTNPVQISAFKAAGWTEKAKPNEKDKQS